MGAAPSFPAYPPEVLEAAFRTLAPLLDEIRPQGFPQPYPAHRVIAALQSLAGPLAEGRAAGGAINIWSIAGLRRDEVRNGQALAGLWTTDFGGTVSQSFLAAFLCQAIEGIDWKAELARGYRAGTESNPLGDSSDRIDVLIETAHHIVGVEIKIGAVLGLKQLERYLTSLKTRAALQHRQAHVVLLAPFESSLDGVHSVPWSAISDAALMAVPGPESQRTMVEALIVSFGDHVRTL